MPRVPPVTTATRAMSPFLPLSWRRAASPFLETSGSPCWRDLALNAHGDSHAAADTKSCEAFLGITLLHFVEQRDQHSAAGSANRMPDRNGTAADVDLRCVPPKVLVDRAGLRSEGLIGFDQVKVAHIPAGSL